MKKIIYLSLFVAIMALAGCQTEPLPLQSPAEKTVTAVNPEVIALIEEMGFSTEGIVETEDAYIAEGDIIIGKESVEQTKNEPKTRHNKYKGDHIVDINQHSSVTISVWNNTTDLPNVALEKYRGVLSGAVAAFKGICPVNLVASTEDQVSDITIQSNVGLTPESMSAAYIPSSGAPGVWIEVNTNPDFFAGNWANISDAKIKSNLIHAIAHCLGLAHTNLSGTPSNMGRPEIETSTEVISGTHSDTSSLMTIQAHLYNSSGATTLSAGDKAALGILYHPPTLSLVINGSSSGNTGKKLTFTVGDGSSLLSTSQYTIKWTASGGTISGGDAGNQLDVTYSSMGNKIISVYAKNKTSGQEASKSLTVHIQTALNPGAISGDQTILSGMVPALLTSTALPTGGSGGPEFQWKQSTNNSKWDDIPNAKTPTYQPPVLTATTYYRRYVTSGTQTAYSNTIKITVEPFNPVISGTNQTMVNTVVTFSSQNLPAGVSVSGYSITPRNYTVVRTSADRTSMDVKFNARGNYTLSVRFSIPGGGTITKIKTIMVQGAPVIRGELWMDFASFRVDDPVISGVTFQWEVNGVIVSPNSWQLLVNNAGNAYSPNNAVYPPSDHYPDLTVQARCRVTSNGVTSGWSNMVSVFL